MKNQNNGLRDINSVYSLLNYSRKTATVSDEFIKFLHAEFRARKIPLEKLELKKWPESVCCAIVAAQRKSPVLFTWSTVAKVTGWQGRADSLQRKLTNR